MYADVVHSGEFAVHVSNADHFVADGEFLGLAGFGKFGLGAEFGEIGHRTKLLAASF
jgi:hypothetical protein